MFQGSRSSVFLLFASFVLFIPYLGAAPLFDWDEINFAECAREMLASGNYLRVTIGYQPFWEKPPLFIWLQALSMSVFGVNEFAARLPNALCGVLTLQILLAIGKSLRSERLGLLWALFYLGSVAPFVYFKSGIIDPWFNLFIFLALFGLYRAMFLKRQVGLTVLWAGVSAGLAILTKGQVAYLLIGATAGISTLLFFATKEWASVVVKFLFFSFVAFAVAALWFGVEIYLHGDGFVREFITYQIRLLSQKDAGHGGFLGYHFVVLLLGCFPASVFALVVLFRPASGEEAERRFTQMMKTLLWVVLVVFSLVQTKIIHYSSLAYFPITYLAAVAAEKLWSTGRGLPRWAMLGLGVVGGLWALVLAALPFVGWQIQSLKPLIKDPFAAANLDANVTWTGAEALLGAAFAALFLWALWQFKQKNYRLSVPVLLIGNAVLVNLIAIFIAPKIERYSQGAAIDFWKSLAHKDCYAETVGYKSYAHYFYTKYLPPAAPQYYSPTAREWLLRGETDKDVYLAVKIHKVHEMESLPQFQKIGQANGFVFYLKKKQP